MTISLKFTFMAMDVQLLQHHLFKEFIFPPLIFFGNFFKNRFGTFMWVYFWVLCSIPLIYMSTDPPISRYLADCTYK